MSAIPAKKTFTEILYLLIFSLAVLAASVLAAIIIDTHWMVPIAIALMAIFLPLTAISFLSYRLPQKQKEFEKIIDALEQDNHSNGDMGERASFILNADFRGTDYLLPVIFNTLFCVLGFYILFANEGLVLFHAMEWVNSGISREPNQVENAKYEDLKIYRQGLVAMGFAFLGAYIWSCLLYTSPSPRDA